jgi:hypothetical protein
VLQPGQASAQDPSEIALNQDSVNPWRVATSLAFDNVTAVHGLPVVVVAEEMNLAYAMVTATSRQGETLLVTYNFHAEEGAGLAFYSLDTPMPDVQPVATEQGHLLLLGENVLHVFNYTQIPPTLLWKSETLFVGQDAAGNVSTGLSVTHVGGIVYVSRAGKAVGLSLNSGDTVWPVPSALSATVLNRGDWSTSWALPSAPQQVMILAQGTPEQSILPTGADAPAVGWWVATEDFQNAFIARAYTIRLPFPASATNVLTRPTAAQPWGLPRHVLSIAHAPEALYIAHAGSGTLATLRLCTTFPAPALIANRTHVAFAFWQAPVLPASVKIAFYTLIVDGTDAFNVFPSIQAFNIPYRTPGVEHTVQVRARLSTGTNLRSGVGNIKMPEDDDEPGSGLAYVDLSLRLLPLEVDTLPETARQAFLAQLCDPIAGAVSFYCYFTFFGLVPRIGGAPVVNGTSARTRSLVSSSDARRIEKEMRTAVTSGALLEALKEGSAGPSFWDNVDSIVVDSSMLGGDVDSSTSETGAVRGGLTRMPVE